MLDNLHFLTSCESYRFDIPVLMQALSPAQIEEAMAGLEEEESAEASEDALGECKPAAQTAAASKPVGTESGNHTVKDWLASTRSTRAIYASGCGGIAGLPYSNSRAARSSCSLGEAV